MTLPAVLIAIGYRTSLEGPFILCNSLIDLPCPSMNQWYNCPIRLDDKVTSTFSPRHRQLEAQELRVVMTSSCYED